MTGRWLAVHAVGVRAVRQLQGMTLPSAQWQAEYVCYFSFSFNPDLLLAGTLLFGQGDFKNATPVASPGLRFGDGNG